MPITIRGPLLSDAEVASFASTFRAFDPKSQDTCVRIINGSIYGMGQAGQDIFVWRNLFARGTVAGERGIYVDSGSWKPQRDSNTWFFDRCLGWSGVCVEPVAEHRPALRAQRSCTVVGKCLSHRSRSARMSMQGALSSVGGTANARNISCVTISNIAQKAGHATIDFWSLDVEGHELAVLSDAWEATGLTVNALLVEDHRIILAELDRLLLTHHSFVKVAQMPLDTLSRRAAATLSEHPWNDAHEESLWRSKLWRDYRSKQPGGLSHEASAGKHEKGRWY